MSGRGTAPKRVKYAHDRMRLSADGGHSRQTGSRRGWVGLTGQVEESTLVIEGRQDLEAIDFTRPVYFLSQTTQSIALFEELSDEMRRRATVPEQVQVNDTICRQVSGREQHLTDFAKRFDTVLFVSGRKSSNGKVLFEVCRQANPHSRQIEEPAKSILHGSEGCSRSASAAPPRPRNG